MRSRPGMQPRASITRAGRNCSTMSRWHLIRLAVTASSAWKHDLGTTGVQPAPHGTRESMDTANNLKMEESHESIVCRRCRVENWAYFRCLALQCGGQRFLPSHLGPAAHRFIERGPY